MNKINRKLTIDLINNSIIETTTILRITLKHVKMQPILVELNILMCRNIKLITLTNIKIKIGQLMGLIGIYMHRNETTATSAPSVVGLKN